MTTLKRKVVSESWESGTHLLEAGFDSPASDPSNIIHKEFAQSRIEPLPNTTSLTSFIEELEEEDSTFIQEMSAARARLAKTLYSTEEDTSFSNLRLSSGMSQTQLAMKASTSQSYIARIENGVTDPGTDVISRLASALELAEELVFKSIRYQRRTRGK